MQIDSTSYYNIRAEKKIFLNLFMYVEIIIIDTF